MHSFCDRTAKGPATQFDEKLCQHSPTMLMRDFFAGDAVTIGTKAPRASRHRLTGGGITRGELFGHDAAVFSRCDMNEDFSRFFKPGCVHRQLYTDPAIFELEMARIFGAAWIYIGHESQVKKPGDYFATQIGRHPVVMTRDAERRACA